MDILAAHSLSLAPQLAKTTKIHAAAEQFEALLIGQLLQAARSAGGSAWMGSDDGKTSTLSEYAEQQFAQALASHGGLGLAKMIVAGLEKNETR